MSWFDDVRGLREQEQEARKLYNQCKKRTKTTRTELTALDVRLAGARPVFDHHKSKRSGGLSLRYVLVDGQVISKDEHQRLLTRAEKLHEILPEMQHQQAEHGRKLRLHARNLRKTAIEQILKADLTDEERVRIEKELGRDDVVIHVSWNRPVIHVYFGDPNNDTHGHGVVDATGRLIYIRPRNTPHGRTLHTTLDMARVRADCSHPSLKRLFFDKPAALVLP